MQSKADSMEINPKSKTGLHAEVRIHFRNLTTGWDWQSFIYNTVEPAITLQQSKKKKEEDRELID